MHFNEFLKKETPFEEYCVFPSSLLLFCFYILTSHLDEHLITTQQGMVVFIFVFAFIWHFHTVYLTLLTEQ